MNKLACSPEYLTSIYDLKNKEMSNKIKMNVISVKRVVNPNYTWFVPTGFEECSFCISTNICHSFFYGVKVYENGRIGGFEDNDSLEYK